MLPGLWLWRARVELLSWIWTVCRYTVSDQTAGCYMYLTAFLAIGALHVLHPGGSEGAAATRKGHSKMEHASLCPCRLILQRGHCCS